VPCTACVCLPDKYKLPALANNFPTVNALGLDISLTWHGTNHLQITDLGGGVKTCIDLGGIAHPNMYCSEFSMKDAIFYQYHHIFDDIQDTW
jgi:hypothetical protein